MDSFWEILIHEGNSRVMEESEIRKEAHVYRAGWQ